MKKFLIVVISILMLFALVACNSNKDTNNSGDNTPVSGNVNKLIADSGATVEGVEFPSDAVLTCTLITDAQQKSAALNKLTNQNYNKEANTYVLDISILKDGSKIQPSGRVTVKVPVSSLNIDTTKDYVLFHINGETVDTINVTIANGVLSFETSSFSEFVLAEKAHEHTFGSLYYAVPASFLADGNIAYYQCSGCHKYFDSNREEVSTIVIPKLSSEIVLMVNGTERAEFTKDEEDDTHILWSLDSISLKKDDVITIAAKADNTTTYSFYPNTNTNITEENKVHNDVTSATVSVVCTPNGLTVSISGFEYDGFTVRVTYASDSSVVEYPMNEITYDFGTPKTNYIYGYLTYSLNDYFEVVDHDNQIVYGYSAVDAGDLWKSFIFMEGTKGAIKVVSESIRLGVEFDTATSKILIDPIYAPNSSTTFELEAKGESEKAPMNKTTYAKDSAEYTDIAFVLTHETTINAEANVAAIANGYDIYTFTSSLPANMELRIYDGTSYVEGLHLADVYGVSNFAEYIQITDDGYIKTLQAATYTIMYHPCIDMYIIEIGSGGGSSTPDDISYMTGGNTYPAVVDSNGLVTLSDLELSAYTSFTFLQGTSVMTDVTLDSSVSSSVAIASSGTIMILNAGTYDIVLNTNTKKVIVTDKTPVSMVGGMVMDSSSSHATKTFVANPGNTAEAMISNLTVTDATYYYAFYDNKNNTVDDLSIATDSTSYLSVLTSNLVTFSQTGVYNLYINDTTHEVRVVRTGDVA